MADECELVKATKPDIYGFLWNVATYRERGFGRRLLRQIQDRPSWAVFIWRSWRVDEPAWVRPASAACAGRSRVK